MATRAAVPSKFHPGLAAMKAETKKLHCSVSQGEHSIPRLVNSLTSGALSLGLCLWFMKTLKGMCPGEVGARSIGVRTEIGSECERHGGCSSQHKSGAGIQAL